MSSQSASSPSQSWPPLTEDDEIPSQILYARMKLLTTTSPSIKAIEQAKTYLKTLLVYAQRAAAYKPNPTTDHLKAKYEAAQKRADISRFISSEITNGFQHVSEGSIGFLGDPLKLTPYELSVLIMGLTMAASNQAEAEVFECVGEKMWRKELLESDAWVGNKLHRLHAAASVLRSSTMPAEQDLRIEEARDLACK